MTAPLGEGIEALSRLVAGNDHLTTEPGLVYAMQTANVTEQQAGAINQFVGGLNAEKAVQAATAAGTKISLSSDEQATLDAMGVDYSKVIHILQPPAVSMRKQMAAQGVQPVVDGNGKVVTDAQGNPKTEPLKPTEQGKFAALLGVDGMSDAELNKKVGENSDTWSEQVGHGIERAAGDVGTGLSKGWNFVSSAASFENAATNPAAARAAVGQRAALMTRQGYDPSSVLSTLAFQSHGYAFNDTSKAQSWWDDQHPDGAFGMNGQQAVTEAEVALNDPKKYTESITADKSLTPEQIATKLKFASSPEFTQLINRVAGTRQTVGTDYAHDLQIDPVKHPTAFKITSTVADTAASFVGDPVAIGLGTYTGIQRASTAIRNFHDAEGISRILTATDKATRAQKKVQSFVHDMVDIGKQYSAAHAAGDSVKMAEAQARAGANPLGGLLADFTGHDRLLDETLSSEDALARAAKGESVHSPYVTGKGEPIDTYDKAVEYLSSKAALFRLGGGKAPVEFSTMPGALSSLGFSRLKGELMAWSAGRSVTTGDKAVAKVLSRAEADPGYAKKLIDDKLLTRLMPQSDDAVDFLTGKVLAARRDAEAGVEGGATALESAKRALADKQSELEASAPLAITDAGRGMVRGNKLRYGTAVAPESTLGKAASIYTLGTAQRARQVVTRISNWLPRDLTIDINSAAGAEDVRRVARTYLTPGDAQLLAARWTAGTADTRRAIIAGLHDQIEHAAGLTRTAAGQAMRAERGGKLEAYSSVGREWVDPAGRNAAQFPGQVETVFKLPNFGKIHKAAAKIGLYEATMGRAMQTKPVESMMALWRLLVLGVPVTAMRAITESFLNAGAKGMLGDTVKAKTVLRASGRLDAAGIRRAAITNAVAGTVGFRDVGRLYRWAVGRKVDPEFQKAIESMPADLFEARLLNQSRFHYAQEVDPGGVGDATEIAHLGLNPRKTVYNTQQAFDVALRQKAGYELTDEVDGQAGANAFAMTLGTRANIAPHVFKAILDRIEQPGEHSIDHVVQALETGEAQRLMHHTLYGKVVLDQDGQQTRALSEADVALGKEQWAQNLVDDVAQLMTGRNGVYQDKLAGFVRQHGHAPDAEWITENIKKQNRPAAMIRPVWNAVVPGMGEKQGVLFGDGKLFDSLNESSGKVYQWAVERLIQRHSTGPLYAAAYGKSKVALEPFKQRLIGEGFTDEAAERLTADIAAQQGWNHVALMVDDPALRSQMDVVGRSFFAFSRATTAMLRRWGTTFYRNPAAARRFQLAAEGAVHSGLVYKDQNGDWMTAIPGSGVAQEVLLHAMSHIPGLSELAKFPVADFTGRVASIVPGSDNPTQYATTPLISIVGRTVAGLFPNHREIFDQIDAKLNGTSGQGQGALDTLMPRLFKMVKDADAPYIGPSLGGEARNSVLTSAMVGALYNLYAAGKVPPDGASPAQQQEFLDNLKTQTRSNLFTRFLLGTISPMSLSTPSDNGQIPADSAFARRGVQSLKDEYKTILNDTGGDLARANAIWANLHPDATVYEDSSTTLNVKGADIPPTQKAYQWLASNGDLIHKYGSLAAYFIPQDKGAFDMAAYRAELEQGFRQRKTPQEFLDGARIASAGSVYYAAEDDMNNELAKAIANQDTTKASAIRAGWSAWAKQFKGQHPTFAEHLVSFATSGSDADMQFRNLQQMVKDGDIPGGKPAKTAVESMVSNFNQYRAFVARYPKTTDADNQAKAWAKSNLQHIFDQIITAHPDLTDLYNGVFRPLERSLTYVQPNTTGGGGA